MFEEQYKSPRPIEDADIESTIRTVRTMYLNAFLTWNITTMLEELLELRRKQDAQ